MKPDIAKYFWDLNEKALIQTRKILRNPSHHQFVRRLVTLLSRCDKPRELFYLVPQQTFMAIWPRVRTYWAKVDKVSDFRNWWETVYEQLLEKHKIKEKRLKGESADLFLRVGAVIREARIKKDLSQNDLALKVGIKQPDVSMIEKGKKNITLETLSTLCKALGIKRVQLGK